MKDDEVRIASWNVNSVRARLPQVLAWLGAATDAPRADVLCLQETKAADDKFPLDDFESAGWHAAHYGQPAYNGVAIISRWPLSGVRRGMPARADDPQARVIGAEVETDGAPLKVVCCYVPNGGEVGAEKYQYKLSWLADFANFLREDFANAAAAVCGDYNIAPADEDIYDAEKWGEGILASPPERAAWRALLDAGFVDAFRMFAQPPNSFTWWDYRAAAFRRNHGLRIDHILLSKTAAARCRACSVDAAPRKNERPSDHTPIIAALARE